MRSVLPAGLAAQAAPAPAQREGPFHAGCIGTAAPVSTAAALRALAVAAAARARRHGRHGQAARAPPPLKRGRRRGGETAVPRRAAEEPLDSLSASLRRAIWRFEEEVAKPDEEIVLAQAAALLALHAKPDLDLEEAIYRPLEQLGVGFRDLATARGLGGSSSSTKLPGAPAPGGGSAGELPRPSEARRLAELLCEHLTSEGFHGCGRSEDEYYSAENSLLDMVLQKRCGIPISLSLVYIEVGRAAGLELHGLNFPGHFLLGFQGDGGDAGLLDAFSNSVLSEEGAEAIFRRLFQTQAKLSPDWRLMPRLPKVMFLARMVRNLQGVYERDGNYSQAARVSMYYHCLQRRLDGIGS